MYLAIHTEYATGVIPETSAPQTPLHRVSTPQMLFLALALSLSLSVSLSLYIYIDVLRVSACVYIYILKPPALLRLIQLGSELSWELWGQLGLVF